MKVPLFLLTAVLGLISVSPLGAAILVDDFSSSTLENLYLPGGSAAETTPNVGDLHASREIVVSGSTVSASVSGGLLQGGISYNSQIEIEYIGFAPLNLTDNPVFQFNTSSVTGTPILTLELGSLASPSLLTGSVQLAPGNSPASFSIDITQLAGYSASFAEQINRITILIENNDDGDASLEGDSVQMVPEPQTWALLALGALFLLWQPARRYFCSPQR